MSYPTASAQGPTRRYAALATVIGLLLASCGTGAYAASDGVSRVQPDPDAPITTWVDGVNNAGLDFHRTLDGNTVSSPLSIGTAFSLVRSGASEPSDTILDSVFGFPEAMATHEAASSVLHRVADSSSGSTTLGVANRLYSVLTPHQKFVDTATRYYGVDIVPWPASVADEVNGWVSDQTNGLVEEVMTDSDVPTDPAQILVNTIYLDAKWATPFEQDDIKGGIFTRSDTTEVSTRYMTQLQDRRYLDRPDSDVVELAYADGGISMWVIVPKASESLADVEGRLDSASVADFSELAIETEVHLKLPRWDTALPPTDLVESWLCPLGLCPDSPFYNIDGESQLNSALHSARITVTEEGTQAAAVTETRFVRVSALIFDGVTVSADRPFAYVIVHEPTNAILFVGRVIDPTEN